MEISWAPVTRSSGRCSPRAAGVHAPCGFAIDGIPPTDLPDGQIREASSRCRVSCRVVLANENRVRAQRKFASQFKLIWVVQSQIGKYFTWLNPKSAPSIVPSRLCGATVSLTPPILGDVRNNSLAQKTRSVGNAQNSLAGIAPSVYILW